MSEGAARAARNNAEWCDAVCRSHGLVTRFDAEAWIAPARTPPLYPDAVSLVADVQVDELLARIDTGPGCSVKDSFASLDLGPFGFRVLFDAEWIVRSASSPAPPLASSPAASWTDVRDGAGLDEWQRAWSGDDGPRDVFRPELLTDEAITIAAVIAAGQVVAGAVFNEGAGVIGVSNVFGVPVGTGPDPTWSDLLAFADARFPGRTLVGYGSGTELATAEHHGFRAIGPLRVWIRAD